MTTVIDSNLKNRALFLYQDSRSARTERGQRTLRSLWSMPNEKFQWSSDTTTPPRGLVETVLSTRPPPLFLEWDAQAVTIDGNRIVVNRRFLDHPQPMVMLSLQLAHEGVHVWKYDQPDVEQELHAHRNEIDYYRELRGGVLREPQEAQELAMRRIDRGTLVDHYVQKFHRADGVVPIDGRWVLRHIRFWGGISRRETETKIAYLSVLREDWSDLPANEARAVVLELAESFDRRPPMSSGAAEWLRDAFGGGTADQQQRLRRLGDRWHVNLDPSRR